MTLNEVTLETSNRFIEKYCLPTKDTQYDTRDPEKIEADWFLFQLTLSSEHINLDHIANHLNFLRYYEEFLITPYWQICRNKKLLDDKFLCQMDFHHNNRRLQVHHKTYKYHGYEAQHMDCLMTLCHDCHDLISKGFVEKKEPEINWGYRVEEFHYKIEKFHKQKELLADLEVLTPVSAPSNEVILNAFGVHPYDMASTYLRQISAECVRIHTFLAELL
jgi:hypothetical protein